MFGGITQRNAELEKIVLKGGGWVVNFVIRRFHQRLYTYTGGNHRDRTYLTSTRGGGGCHYLCDQLILVLLGREKLSIIIIIACHLEHMVPR